MVCPAFQSAFIYDKGELARKFSYFEEDSIPKELSASKDKFLIIEKMPYRKKLRAIATIEMEPVYPVIDDSTAFAGDQELIAELDVLDSTMLDSMAMLPPWEEKFNVEQETYLYYFNDILVYPDERAALEAADAKMKEIEGTQKKKKGFFKRLFGKKNSEDEPGELKESLIGDEDGEGITEESGKKRGLFGRKRKKRASPDIGEDDQSNEAFEGPADNAGQEKKRKKRNRKRKNQSSDVDNLPAEDALEEEDDDGFDF